MAIDKGDSSIRKRRSETEGDPWPGEEWVEERRDQPNENTGGESGLGSSGVRDRPEEENEEEECERAKIMHDPGQLTKQEIEEHHIDHAPYRSWCSHCVKGRGVGKPHRARRDKQTIPVFGLDYMHTSEVCGNDDGEGSHTTEVLVAKCQKTRCVFSHVVP